jgi:hypothetical protein
MMTMKSILKIIRLIIALTANILFGIALLPRFAKGLFPPTPTATVQPSITPISLSVRARIDGISQLVIQGDTARWYHVLGSAPGRWLEASIYLNEKEWNPVWPDIPDRGNHNCECYSSIYSCVPAIAYDPPIILEIVQARGKVSTIQQPGRGNDYTLIVEFDHVIMPDKTYGDEWYEINLITKE